MKKLLPGIFVVIFYTGHISCNKSSVRPGQPNLNLVTVEVVEYKTNKPLEGAQFSIFNQPPFQSINEVQTEYTDAKGTCQIYEANLGFQNEIYIKVPNYREFDTRKGSTPDSANPRRFTLDKIGRVKIDLIDSTGFSGRAYINLTYQGERLNSSIVQTDFLLKLVDTSFTYIVYGEQTNTISLKVVDSNNNIYASSGPYVLFVPNTGTSKLEIKY